MKFLLLVSPLHGKVPAHTRINWRSTGKRRWSLISYFLNNICSTLSYTLCTCINNSATDTHNDKVLVICREWLQLQCHQMLNAMMSNTGQSPYQHSLSQWRNRFYQCIRASHTNAMTFWVTRKTNKTLCSTDSHPKSLWKAAVHLYNII